MYSSVRLFAATAAALAVAACGNGQQQQQMPPVDVSVAPVVKKSITQWDEYSGHIEAIESPEPRALSGRQPGPQGTVAVHH